MKKNFSLNRKYKVGTEQPVSLDNLTPNKKDTDENFKIIPYENLIPNSENRKISVTANIERLADSIRTFGLIDSLRVKDEGNGKYSITSGERRWRAIGLIREKDPTFMSDGVRCYVAAESTDNIDEEARMIIANIEREDYTPEERRTAVKRLHDIFQEKKRRGDFISERLLDGADPEKASATTMVAKQLDITPRQVQKILSINDYLSPDWLEEYDAGRIKINDANDISHLNPDNQKALFDIYKEKGSLDLDNLKAFRSAEKEEAAFNKELSKKYKELEQAFNEMSKNNDPTAAETYTKTLKEVEGMEQHKAKQNININKRSTELRLFNSINLLEKSLYSVEKATQHQELTEGDVMRLQVMTNRINKLISSFQTEGPDQSH